MTFTRKGMIAASMLPLGITILGVSLCLVKAIEYQREINEILNNLSKDQNLLVDLSCKRDEFMYCSIGFGIAAAIIIIAIIVYVMIKEKVNPLQCLKACLPFGDKQQTT